MVLYLIGSTLTFGLLMSAFLQDKSTSKSDILSWLVVTVGSLIWFVCLPFIIRKKLAGVRRHVSPAVSGQAA